MVTMSRTTGPGLPGAKGKDLKRARDLRAAADAVQPRRVLKGAVERKVPAGLLQGQLGGDAQLQ